MTASGIANMINKRLHKAGKLARQHHVDKDDRQQHRQPQVGKGVGLGVGITGKLGRDPRGQLDGGD